MRVSESAPVLERFSIKGRGWVVVLDLYGSRGDVLRCGNRTWAVLGVEKHAMPNPRPPFGFLVGASAPEVGELVTIELRETLEDLRRELEAARRRITELESDRARLDDLLARAYRSE